MSSRQKWVCCCLVGSLFLIYLAASGGRAVEPQTKIQAGSQERLRELLEQRYEILMTLVARQTRLAEMGRGSLGKVAEATVAMLRAEADLRATDSERIDIHEKIVGVLQEVEDAMAREVKAGHAAAEDMAKVRLRKLEARIELERIKLAQQASQ